jgi:hypothetical protein
MFFRQSVLSHRPPVGDVLTPRPTTIWVRLIFAIAVDEVELQSHHSSSGAVDIKSSPISTIFIMSSKITHIKYLATIYAEYFYGPIWFAFTTTPLWTVVQDAQRLHNVVQMLMRAFACFVARLFFGFSRWIIDCCKQRVQLCIDNATKTAAKRSHPPHTFFTLLLRSDLVCVTTAQVDLNGDWLFLHYWPPACALL